MRKEKGRCSGGGGEEGGNGEKTHLERIVISINITNDHIENTARDIEDDERIFLSYRQCQDIRITIIAIYSNSLKNINKQREKKEKKHPLPPPPLPEEKKSDACELTRSLLHCKSPIGKNRFP